MLLERPYFMENKDWYYHDDKINRYKLTDKAPKQAVKSYNEYYEQLDSPDPDTMNSFLNDTEIYYRNKLSKAGKSQQEIDEAVKEWRDRISK